VKNFQETYKELKKTFELNFYDVLNETSFKTAPSKFKSAILYSLKAKGKRIRPVLFLATSSIISGISFEKRMAVATALECLHTYSLIHDDLPAMDNDDYRRGKLTSHKKFSEEVAILAGDALQSLAYELLTLSQFRVETIQYFAQAVGPSGMIGGQYLDVTLNQTNKTQLKTLQQMKTAALIRASILLLYVETKKPAQLISEAEIWAENLGELFQLTDDIIDITQSSETIGKTSGKDKAQKKLTQISALGLDKAITKAKKLANDLSDSSDEIFYNSEFFNKLPLYILNRKK